MIVAGGRDVDNYHAVEHACVASGFDITEVVSGCARGADYLGEVFASHCGLQVKRFPADWVTHGRAAGPIRNRQMAEYAEALVLVWDGKSLGSASMRREAQKCGLPIYEHLIR